MVVYCVEFDPIWLPSKRNRDLKLAIGTSLPFSCWSLSTATFLEGPRFRRCSNSFQLIYVIFPYVLMMFPIKTSNFHAFLLGATAMIFRPGVVAFSP
jgi:hypothetical protein